MMKRTLLLLCMMLLLTATRAQNVGERVRDDLKQQTTFGGYVVGQATGTTQDGQSKKTDMGIRFFRAYIDGRVLNVAYKVQMQMSGTPGSISGPRIVDAWAEWQPLKELHLKFGQMKRCFTFENPMHPWSIGYGSYSQLSLKLAGFNDRVGEHAANGRDFGLQLQGDLFPSRRDGHRWMHYQVGVYNGQGTNQADANTRKDLIGGLWLSPVEDLQVGAFGWLGNYVKDGVTVDRNRYAFGLKYTGTVTVRSEYARSFGYKVSDHFAEDGSRITPTGSKEADAWYILAGTTIAPRTRMFVKWDVYRDLRTWATSKSIYGLSAEHSFHPNLMLQANYAFNNDRALGKQNYHTFDLQLYWRF